MRSISAAQESSCFDCEIIVSTDDEEIAEVARSCGAEVPFLRPTHLADDQATTQDVIGHALEWLQRQGQVCEALCCLYATAPFVQPTDLQSADKNLSEVEAGTVVFLRQAYSFPIQRAIRIDSEGYSSMFQPDQFATRSQDLEEAFHDAGQFYWATPQTWSTVVNLFEGARPIILSRWRVRILIQRKIGSVLNSCISCLSSRADRHSATFSWCYFSM